MQPPSSPSSSSPSLLRPTNKRPEIVDAATGLAQGGGQRRGGGGERGGRDGEVALGELVGSAAGVPPSARARVGEPVGAHPPNHDPAWVQRFPGLLAGVFGQAPAGRHPPIAGVGGRVKQWHAKKGDGALRKGNSRTRPPPALSPSPCPHLREQPNAQDDTLGLGHGVGVGCGWCVCDEGE